jgi:glycolate oxidase iron-sulfur subunit
MQTSFTLAQLADPHLAEVERILRKCVHCGFCTATCPTYVLRGDERDSPRGRIYLVKSLLEGGLEPTAATMVHLDRCLTCLSCMTTCPSGVDYVHLIDRARALVHARYKRPMIDRALRALLAYLLPRPDLFRLAARLAGPFKFLAPLMPRQVRAMLRLTPSSVSPASKIDQPGTHGAIGRRRKRVAMLPGCAQQVLRPGLNEATVRLLTKLGCEVVVAEGSGCCGALVHHMGDEAGARAFARANVAAWTKAAIDAVVINASGCGTLVKDYGHLLEQDGAAADARSIAAKTRDVSELIAELDLPPSAKAPVPLVVALHLPCSMQHGQKIRKEPRDALEQAGFKVIEPQEAHLCCGSAGVYNILEPEIASQLGERKAQALAGTGAQVIATGNIGCLAQISAYSGLPVVHTVELLDWAAGGPPPPELANKGLVS